MLGGKVNTDKKQHFYSLLSMIRARDRDMYDLICMLSLEGVFNTSRWQNTFLMPSKKMVREIEVMVEQDRDEEAVNALRSLILKRHFSSPSKLAAEKEVSTLHGDANILADPKAVAAQLKPKEKVEVLNSRSKAVSFIVLFFDESGKLPETKKGGSSAPAPSVGKVSKFGGAGSEHRTAVAKITAALTKDDPKMVLENFEKAVAGVLSILQNTDADRFAHAKYFLSSNPIVSWFLLTLPGRSDALVRAEDLKDFAWRAVSLDHNSILEEAKAVQYDEKDTTAQLQKVKHAREELMNADKLSLIPKILHAYKSHNSNFPFFNTNQDLKILMDEVLFLHDGSTHPRMVSDCLTDLQTINWAHPRQSWVICNSHLYDKMLMRSTEAFNSGPKTFLKSAYFLHVPLSSKMEQSIVDNMAKSGAIVGGNPSAIQHVLFMGGAARHAKRETDLKLSALVKVMSKAQREKLKALLS